MRHRREIREQGIGNREQVCYRLSYCSLFPVICSLVLAAPALADFVNVKPMQTLPVLDHGRVKPIDTLARETVQFVTGSEFFGSVSTDAQGQQTLAEPRRHPLDMVLDWAGHPVAWQTQPILYVPLIALRQELGMKETQQWISPRQVMENTDFTASVRGLEQDRLTAQQNNETILYKDTAEKDRDDAAIELDNRLKTFEAASDLSLYCILPTDGPKSDTWMPLSAVMTLTGQDGQTAQPIQAAWSSVLDAYRKGDSAAFAAASADLSNAVRQVVGDDYSDSARINREIFYNDVKPFRWTWVIYLLAVIALICALLSTKKIIYVGAMSLLAVAIAFHAAAFALRCSITGWAPVTNMYETIIWVAMMGAVFSFVLELIYRRRVIAIGGAVVAVLATVVADALPTEFGSSIRNLTPVLRSNYWLTIHVLTIVSSYAGFALAMILGNIVLAQFIHGRTDPAVIRTNLLFTYRAVQIGVLLVAAGTILGGLWADVSWGRFWGWDAKEVWALIVLLTYLALLHGRHAGWIKQFGLAAGAVLCFTAVLMSWYGVNFVLRAGLHSYGFGEGGFWYVFGFVLIQLAYVLVAWLIYRLRQKPRVAAAAEPLPRGVPITGK
jgi:ABC-type transport system involved in cytochrome c biogenesis permease subunit